MTRTFGIAVDPFGRVPYHLGMVTRDLDAAMAHFTEHFDMTWGPVVDTVEPGLSNPDAPVQWTCRRAHTMGGPFHIELLEGNAGSIWATDALAVPHHLAYWSDDVPGEIDELVARGWRLEATLRDEGGRAREFGYLSRPGELRIELVGSHRRDAYFAMVEPERGGE